MHSSRMRTVYCSGCRGCIPARTGQGVYPSMHWAGGVSQHALGRGDVWLGGLSGQGLSAQWGVCSGGGVCPGEEGVFLGVSAQGSVCQTPCEQNDWQMLVKTLPCHNYVAAVATNRSQYGECLSRGFLSRVGSP